VPADVDGSAAGVAERLWFGRSVGAQIGRVALAPLAGGYIVAAEARQRLYDWHLLPTHPTAVPAISVGNLTVGGTGKTPVAAWLVSVLRARGHRPGIVLRGYGDGDEVLVHQVLNPGTPTIANPDRIAGIRGAAEQGSDVVVLDDAFQHRRARRILDLVLVSADAWSTMRWPIPAGPWREPLRALRRASVVLITRKVADGPTVAAVTAAIRRVAPAVPVAVVSLLPAALRTMTGDTRSLASLRGTAIRAFAGVAWPAAFFAQLRAQGARVDGVPFPDHHRYTTADIAAIRHRAPPGVIVVCTLKDAVKLRDLWPRAGDPIWYVSQRVEFERGVESVHAALDTAYGVRPERVP
jgi:tetraacyldisaccharide 4'-kinase